MRREQFPERGAAGETVRDADGTFACFRLEAEQGRIVSAQYRCTSCMTLVGLCEHLAHILPGLTPEEALGINLLGMHPEIPAARRDRADLALRAMRSAVRQQTEGERD